MTLSIGDKIVIGRYVKKGFQVVFNYVRCYFNRAVVAGKDWVKASSMVRIFGDDELDKYFTTKGEKIVHEQFIKDQLAKKEVLVYMNQILSQIASDDELAAKTESYMNWSFVDSETKDIFQLDPKENVAYKLYDFKTQTIVHEQVPYSAAYFSAIPLTKYIQKINENFISKIPEIHTRLYPLVQITEIEDGKISFKDFDSWADYLQERFIKEVAGPRALGREVNSDLLDIAFLKMLVTPVAREYLKEMTQIAGTGRELNLKVFYQRIEEQKTSYWSRVKAIAQTFYNDGVGGLLRNKSGVKAMLSSDYEDKIKFSKFLADPIDYTAALDTDQYFKGLTQLEAIQSKLNNATMTASIENKQMMINAAVEDAGNLTLGMIFTDPQLLSKILYTAFGIMVPAIGFIFRKAFLSTEHKVKKVEKTVDEEAEEDMKLWREYAKVKVEKAKRLREEKSIDQFNARNTARAAVNQYKFHKAVDLALIDAAREASNSISNAQEQLMDKWRARDDEDFLFDLDYVYRRKVANYPRILKATDRELENTYLAKEENVELLPPALVADRLPVPKGKSSTVRLRPVEKEIELDEDVYMLPPTLTLEEEPLSLSEVNERQSIDIVEPFKVKSAKIKKIQKMNQPIITEPDDDPSINNGEIIVDDAEEAMVSEVRDMIPFQKPLSLINASQSPLISLVKPIAQRYFPFGVKVFDIASGLLKGGLKLYDMYNKHKEKQKRPRVEDVTPSVLDAPPKPLGIELPGWKPSFLDIPKPRTKRVPDLEWGPPKRVPIWGPPQRVPVFKKRRTSKKKKLEIDEEFYQIF